MPHPPAGKQERKEHILDERDSLFCELRHKHFAAASLRISGLMDEFRSKNKMGVGGWGVGGGGRGAGALCRSWVGSWTVASSMAL